MAVHNELVILANELDRAGYRESANAVDSVLRSLNKTAQYVGVQGYWVRNDRCWKNCYRQKRASTPKKPVQEVWFECQAEYADSINKDDSKWDKYASADLQMTKSASFHKADQYFAKQLTDRVATGEDHATAAFNIITEATSAIRDSYIDASEKMLAVAEDLEKADRNMAAYAGALAGKLTKEAGPLDFMRGISKSVKQLGNTVSYNGATGRVSGQLTKAIQNLQNAITNWNQTLAKVRQNVGKYQNKTNASPQIRDQAQKAAQKLDQLKDFRIQNQTTDFVQKFVQQFQNVIDGVDASQPVDPKQNTDLAQQAPAAPAADKSTQPIQSGEIIPQNVYESSKSQQNGKNGINYKGTFIPDYQLKPDRGGRRFDPSAQPLVAKNTRTRLFRLGTQKETV
jgi:hypothetical protein